MKTNDIDESDPFICGTPSGAPTIAFVVLMILSLFAGGLYASKHPRANPSTTVYDKAVNETLDVTLEVGSEFRAAHRKATWREIQLEVCRRLRVQRKEPWQR